MALFGFNEHFKTDKLINCSKTMFALFSFLDVRISAP